MEQITSKLEVGQAIDLRHLEQTFEFLQIFVDKCHHGKAEKVLFPAMEEAGISREGGPIGAMLYEHEQGRSYVQGNPCPNSLGECREAISITEGDYNVKIQNESQVQSRYQEHDHNLIQYLLKEFGISHTTIELETGQCGCTALLCHETLWESGKV